MYKAGVDIRPQDGGGVWSRKANSPDTIQRALTDIQRAYPHISDIDHIIITTWDHVGYASFHTDKVRYPNYGLHRMTDSTK